MTQQSSKHNPKIDWGFYAVTPRIVRTRYKELSHAEKWLYCCLKDLCGDKGTCFRTLRSLAEETDISIGSLSMMIPHLHAVGLIHAEKKSRGHGGKEIWHISIVDIWQANKDYCSKNEQSQEDVQEMNKDVQNLNDKGESCSENERSCSNFVDRRITLKNNNTEERTSEEESVPVSSSHPPLSQDAIALATPPPVPAMEEKEKEFSNDNHPGMDRRTSELHRRDALHLPHSHTPHAVVDRDGTAPPQPQDASKQGVAIDEFVQHAKVTQASPPAKPARKPKVASDEDAALVARCHEIQAKINELRGFALKRAGLIIDERKVIRDHLAKENFSDERIERIHSWIVTNIWKYKSVGGRGDVGARVIWEESGRAEAVLVAPLPSRQARPRYNEHGVDMSEYSLSALFAQQQQRQEAMA